MKSLFLALALLPAVAQAAPQPDLLCMPGKVDWAGPQEKMWILERIPGGHYRMLNKAGDKHILRRQNAESWTSSTHHIELQRFGKTFVLFIGFDAHKKGYLNCKELK